MLKPEQIEMRKKGIGGSEIAAVVGLNPWTSAQTIWARKVGLEPEAQDNAAMERGRILEPALLRWVEERTGDQVVPCTTTYQHPEFRILMATPDGFATRGNHQRVVEVKSPGARTAQHWIPPEELKDGVPYYYIPQLMWEMAATQINEAYVGALIGGRFLLYEVPFNRKLYDGLQDRAKEFWRYVEIREPPPVRDEKGAEWMKEFYRVQLEPELLKLTGSTEKEIGELVKLYDKLNREVKQQTTSLNTIKGQIQQVIGPRAGLLGKDWKVTWKQAKDSVVVDWRAVAHDMGASDEDHPLVKHHTKTKPGTRRFLVGTEESEDE